MSASKKLPRIFVALLLCLGMAAVATAANRAWIGGNADWTTSNANWSSSDEPDDDDVAVFNTANTVNLGIGAQTILGLTLSGGINLSTNGNDLTVNGLVQLSDASTDLLVGGAGSLLSADSITINSGGDITLTGGQITIIEETGSGLLDVNNGGELSGNGIIQFSDAVAAGTQLFNLDGTLTAHSTAPNDLLSFTAATLTIIVADSDGLIDLDGNDGISTINVLRNDTLAINGGVLDSAYSGTINLSPGATFSRNVAWSMNGTINANSAGSTAATISGAAFTQSAGLINLDAGESLRVSSPFHAADGVIANNGLIIFNNTATIDNASQLQTGSQGSIEVDNGEVTIFDQGWDWDGDGGLDNNITINDLGSLRLFSLLDDAWDGAMYINGGTLAVFDTWSQAGGLINIGGTTTSSFSVVGPNATFSKNGGTFNVAGQADLVIQTDTVWSGGILNVDGELDLNNPVTWNGGITVTGNGAIYTETSSVVTSNTTINVHTFDWDGFHIFQNNVHTINDGVMLKLNIVNFDADTLDDDMEDALNLGGNGSALEISGPARWIMKGTLTANTAGAGMANINGHSRMVLAGILNVNGDTTITAPITFNGGSTTSVKSGTTLHVESIEANDAIYDGGVITGAGTFIPAGGLGSNSTEYQNIVQSSSTISTNAFNFDQGGWRIEPGATLTVDVNDYDTFPGTNAFGSWIAINSGTVNVNTADAEFVLAALMDLNNTTGVAATWTGEPLSVGIDGTGINALLRVGGTGVSRINSVVTFRSGAKVDIATGAALVLGNSASFYSVHGVTNAEFTGGGTLVTNGFTTVFETTTLNMSSGTVDFDGENSDASGNLIILYAPLVVNAGNFESFGAAKASADTLLVDNEASAGSLTVNLTNPNAEWTLDAPGVLQLINNTTNATLLSGSDINLNGSVFVRGAVQSDARLDIGGSIQKLISGGTLRLNGGDNLNDPNTLVGGSILADVHLAANTGRALHGFGEIRGNIDFDGTANLLAQNGTLTLYGAILDVGTIGTANSSGILNVASAWNTNVTDLVQLNGGELRGATVTNGGAAGINGFGLVSARVVNSTRIDAEGGALVVETSANDNDWDGPVGTGSLNAISGDLEIRDDATFPFAGTASASAGRTLFANDFELEFEPGSTLSLADGARYRSTNGTHLGGAVMVTGGTALLETDAAAVFETGSTVTLTGNLRLENPLTVVEAGASFSGGGTLNNAAGRTLQLLDGANVGVLIKNQGTLELGASAGQVQGLDFQQDIAGLLDIELAGTGLNDFDRMTLIGQALLAGELNVSLLDGFSPVAGNAFTFLSAVGGVAGTFDAVSLPALNTGLSWSINYNPTNIQLLVVQALPGDFNGDGSVNAGDYVVWRKGLGTAYTPNDYNVWRAHFGQTTGSGMGVSVNAAIPEPGTLVLVIFVPAGSYLWRRRYA